MVAMMARCWKTKKAMITAGVSARLTRAARPTRLRQPARARASSVISFPSRKRVAAAETAAKPRAHKAATSAASAAKRTSHRLQGLPPTPTTANDGGDGGAEGDADGGDLDGLEEGLVSAEEVFAADVVARAVRVDGHFHGMQVAQPARPACGLGRALTGMMSWPAGGGRRRRTGWINPTVQDAHGLEASAAAAWEANGGGTFSFRNPLGAADASRTPSPKRSKVAGAPSGWSEARYTAFRLFRKNPNAYFYRHTEPGVVRASACFPMRRRGDDVPLIARRRAAS